MAAPNVVNVATIKGENAVLALTTSVQTLVNNAASSGKLLKVNSITVANVDGTNNADVTISLYSQDDVGGTATKIAHLITVPAKATLIVLDKSLYLKEDQSIGASASANSDLEAIASWEDIS
jgi:hypothetical protein